MLTSLLADDCVAARGHFEGACYRNACEPAYRRLADLQEPEADVAVP